MVVTFIIILIFLKECKISDGHIVSVIPGDFDGDGSVDILVVVKKPNQENFVAKIIWTDRYYSQTWNELVQ